MEVIHQVGWIQVEEAVFIGNSGLWPSSNLTTHLAISNSSSNVVHELRHDICIIIASRVTRVLHATERVLELVFDSFQGTRENSMFGPIERDRNS